jgi:hypothetical protein
MEVICINTNYLNNINGKVPGRMWTPGDPEIDKVYNILEVMSEGGVEYYKLECCLALWWYEASSFEKLVDDEVIMMELEKVGEMVI